MPLTRPFALVVVLLCLGLSLAAQENKVSENRPRAGAGVISRDSPSAQVDAYIAEQLRAQRIPGLALGVVRDGKLIKAQGYGLANVELGVAVTPETIFQTGSVGKQFTATAIMMLAEEGKVGLDEKISKYLPGTPVKWKDVTIRNLLTHTSGISDYASDENVKHGGLIDLRQDYAEDELFQKFTMLPMNFKPGEKWSYSNTGYVLLGILIHEVTGEFYGDFLQQRIFRALGMTSTRIISEADIIPNRSSGYEMVKGEIKNQQWVSPTLNTTADGALYTNVLDMAKWDAALYTEQLLKRSSFDEMWAPAILSNGKQAAYGFGWDIAEVNGHRLIEHGGAWQGFTTHISRYIDDRVTVIILTNLDADHSQPDAIAHAVAAIYLPAVGSAGMKPTEDKEPEVTALVRVTLAELAAGHANLDLFPVDQRQNWVPERIQKLSEKLQRLGPLKSIDLVERGRDGTIKHYKYLVVFAAGSMIVNLALDSDGKMDGLQIRPQ
jgi:CubicO group peptidase (beta-lactamase class C family)